MNIYSINKQILITMIVLVFGLGASFAQNTRITGVGEGIKDKNIRIIAINDLISYYEEELANQVASEDGFELGLSLSSPTLLTLRIESFDYSFIAEPGEVYNLRLLPFNFDIADSINTLFYKINLPIIIENEEETSLNRRIFEFDSVVDRFIFENSKAFLVQKQPRMIDSLRSIFNYFSNLSLEGYFKDYVEYSSEIILLSSGLTTKERIKTERFFSKPILYDNLGYMECFEYVYGNYFSMGNTYIEPERLDYWLSEKDYFSLFDSLGLDTLLRNEVFRELVFLRGMKEAYYSNYYIGYEVLDMLERFIYETKFEEHKTIAKGLIKELEKKSFKGRKIEEHWLNTLDNKEVAVSGPKSKPSLISFVRLNEVQSRRELDVIYGFYEDLKEDYELITISCDRNIETMYNFLINSKVGSQYKWDFLHFDGKWDVLEDFNVRVFPTFILLDRQGRVVQNPMRSPLEGGLLELMEK